MPCLKNRLCWLSSSGLLGLLIFPGQQVWFMVGVLGRTLHGAAERMRVLGAG